MSANSSIVLTQLDFDSYKSSLKSYLKSQDRFKDYDFEGSNLSVLLDLLAYNTYNNAFYLNMVGNEMFLDSAKLRDSVVSHAKELNYLPRSFKSASATIQLTVTPTDGNTTKKSIVVPKGTAFISRVDDFTYTFTTNENVVITNYNNGSFISDSIAISEGNYLSETYAVNYSNPLVYRINNKRVDITSVLVTVIEDNGASTLNYTRATSLFGHDENSRIFFIQPSFNDTYEIVFGDGVVGRKPKNGSVVLIEYRVCSGELPNGAFKFVHTSRIDGQSNVVVTTITSATGGEVAEDLNSIKYNAPRAFTTQERAVTAEDYENLLKANYPEINAVTAYGGEDASPPQYGRIFLSIDLKDVDGLPLIKQNEYKRFLRSRSSVAMEPLFVSPEYTYLHVVTNIKYNINRTGLNPEDIRTYVIGSIIDYASNNLNNFSRTLRYSKLVNAIDQAEASIISNETEVELVKYITPVLNQNASFVVDFKNSLAANIPLLPDEHASGDIHTISSSTFTYSGIQNCILEDDGEGNVRIVTPVGSSHKVVNNVGTVDYTTGLVQIKNINISNYSGTSLKIYAKPSTKDITSVQNVILNIIESDIDVTIQQIRE